MYLAMVSSLFAGSHDSHSHAYTPVENIFANISSHIVQFIHDILEHKSPRTLSRIVFAPFSFSSQIFIAGEDPMLSDQQQYRYMTVDDMKSMGDDSMRVNVTDDERDNRHSGGK